MSKFTNYFFNTLKWLPIFKKGAIACIIEGLARYFDKIRQDILFVRNQFYVENADYSLVALYGQSRGILRSRYDNDEEYRARVISAYRWQLFGGKVTGLPKILADYGFKGGSIVNLKYTDSKRWAEFDFIYNDNTLFADKYENMVSLINQYKPARSRLNTIIFPYKSSGGYYVAGVARVGQKIKILRG